MLARASMKMVQEQAVENHLSPHNPALQHYVRPLKHLPLITLRWGEALHLQVKNFGRNALLPAHNWLELLVIMSHIYSCFVFWCVEKEHSELWSISGSHTTHACLEITELRDGAQWVKCMPFCTEVAVCMRWPWVRIPLMALCHLSLPHSLSPFPVLIFIYAVLFMHKWNLTVPMLVGEILC